MTQTEGAHATLQPTPVALIPDDDQVAQLSGVLTGTKLEHWTGADSLPPSSADVEFVVAPIFPPEGFWDRVASLPRLKVVQLLTAGFEHVVSLVPEGVILCNARGVHDPAVAEWVLAAVLAQQRGIPTYLSNQTHHSWLRGEANTLFGKTVLFLGYGSIAAEVERLMAPFGIEPIRVASRARDSIHAISELGDLLPAADVVIVLLPGSPSTANLMNADLLSRMRDGALLVNAGRGGAVDTAALVTELGSGRLRAALDVVNPEPLPDDHPMWDAPGLLLTPHIASDFPNKEARMYQLVRDQLQAFAHGKPLANVVHG